MMLSAKESGAAVEGVCIYCVDLNVTLNHGTRGVCWQRAGTEDHIPSDHGLGVDPNARWRSIRCENSQSRHPGGMEGCDTTPIRQCPTMSYLPCSGANCQCYMRAKMTLDAILWCCTTCFDIIPNRSGRWFHIGFGMLLIRKQDPKR